MTGALDNTLGNKATFRHFNITLGGRVIKDIVNHDFRVGRSQLPRNSNSIRLPIGLFRLACHVHTSTGNQIDVTKNSESWIIIPGVGAIKFGVGRAVKNRLTASVLYHYIGKISGDVPWPKSVSLGWSGCKRRVPQIRQQILIVLTINQDGNPLLMKVTFARR